MERLWKRVYLNRRGPITLTVLSGVVCAGALVVGGYHRREGESEATPPAAEAPAKTNTAPVVRVVRPEVRTMTHAVSQPGFVEAYEQTAIYSMVSGFIKKFNVDIGDSINEGQTLCEIDVPELKEEHDQKVEQVKLDREAVKQAIEMIDVAKHKLETADADVQEAEADVARYQAAVTRWTSEVRRLNEMVKKGVMDEEIRDEQQRQLDTSKADKKAAESAVAAKKAAVRERKADLKKANVDKDFAEEQVKVAEAAERKAKAILDYTIITAPYDGVVTVRNANKGDYVQAAAGDKDNAKGSPIFVVARTDKVRIYVDVPEDFAPYVHKGTPAEVNVEPLTISNWTIRAPVTRISWSLHEGTRTLRAEIDLPIKPNDGLRPGNYVVGKVFIEQAKSYVLPEEALKVRGDGTYCYLVVDGKVKKTPIRRGMDDGNWVKVVQKKVGGSWRPFTGREQVIVSDTGELADGQAVQTAPKEPTHSAAKEQALAKSQ